MNKNVYKKTEVVFKMTWVRKKKKKKKKKKEKHSKRLETIVKIKRNVSLNENFTSALPIGLGRICVWLSLTMPKTIKLFNMAWYV